MLQCPVYSILYKQAGIHAYTCNFVLYWLMQPKVYRHQQLPLLWTRAFCRDLLSFSQEIDTKVHDSCGVIIQFIPKVLDKAVGRRVSFYYSWEAHYFMEESDKHRQGQQILKLTVQNIVRCYSVGFLRWTWQLNALQLEKTDAYIQDNKTNVTIEKFVVVGCDSLSETNKLETLPIYMHRSCWEVISILSNLARTSRGCFSTKN